LQECQANHIKPPVIAVRRFPDPQVSGVARLIRDFLNELNPGIEASRFYYERYLDFIEISFDVEDDSGVSPDAFIQRAQELHERAQVQCMIESADTLLERTLTVVLNL
jgi:hypothetical protein